MSEGNGTHLVDMRDIVKTFGTINVLRGIDFVVGRQEIVGLLGDNGAGKSTLIKILTGVYTPSGGQIYFEGQPVTINSPQDARAIGIETVYQDLALVPLMSISRNFWLGQEITRRIGPFEVLDKQEMADRTRQALLDIGIHIRNPDEPVGSLSGGERQSIAIGRAVYFGKKLLILDEPTSALGQKQQMEVLKTIQRVRLRGDIAIIFITHNEVHAKLVADRFTFLALGEVIGRGTRAQLEGEDIRHLMAGGANISDLQKELEAVRLSGRAAS